MYKDLPNKGYQAVFDFLFVFLVAVKLFGKKLFFLFDAKNDDKGIGKKNGEGIE